MRSFGIRLCARVRIVGGLCCESICSLTVLREQTTDLTAACNFNSLISTDE